MAMSILLNLLNHLLLQLRKVKAELGELSNNPQGLLLEAIHSAGYSGALAYPLLAPEEALNRLDGPSLEEFVAVRSVILSGSA
jgi:processing peptidase subunit alpha